MSTERKSTVTVYLPNSTLDWIEEQDESRSELTREALAQLREEREANDE